MDEIDSEILRKRQILFTFYVPSGVKIVYVKAEVNTDRVVM